MFTKEEIASIDKTYFEIIRADGIAIELRSRNTSHFWRIRSEYDYATKKYHCVVEHRHKRIYPYHYQWMAIKLSSAMNKIMKHDRFYMAGRDPNVYRKRHRN